MELETALFRYFRYKSFRPLQKDIIESILKGNDTVALLPTGAGKSICFQLPALMFPGITIVVTPLIALMQDQVDNLIKKGVPATYISSTLSRTEVSERIELLKLQKYKLLYVAPERLKHKRFIRLCKKLSIQLVVVDEAHCMIEWGADFRPEYLEIKHYIHQLPRRPVIAAFTATATHKTIHAITEYLNLQTPSYIRASFLRNNLQINVFETTSFQMQEILLLFLLKKHQGQSGIIYVSTRSAAQKITEFIQKFLHTATTVGYYHGGVPAAQRQYIQKLFMADALQIVVATSAFGMGVDKANISFIIHFHLPGSIEAYYQEIGRAGRDGTAAHCYLLYNQKNLNIQSTLHEESTSKEARSYAIQRLHAVEKYIDSKLCRMQSILMHFGEKKCLPCGTCDNCNNQTSGKDYLSISSVLQKIVAPVEYSQIVSLHQKRLAIQNSFKLSHYAQVLSDYQLLLMHMYNPKSHADFATIPGCGTGWIKQWAPLFLQKSDKIAASIK
jgi:ATP-dependent DNA helicase RecQ